MTSLAATIIGLAGSSILSIDGSFLLIFASVFLLIFVLNRTLFLPITRILEEREKLGLGRSAEARKLLKEAEERARNYETLIRAAHAAAYRQVEDRRRGLKLERQRLLAQEKSAVEAQIAAARREIAQQARAARARLEEDARSIAASISSQLLKRPVAPGGTRA